MATGTLTPDARLRVLSDLGVVLPGAKLNTYIAGSVVTPRPTFSDKDLLVPNTNPLIASAGGLFGPIFLTPGVGYQYVLTDANDVPIWSQDNIGVDLVVSAVVAAAIAAGVAPVVQTTTVTGAQNNFALTAGVTLLRVNNAALVTFSGFSAGFDGQRLTVEHLGAAQADYIPQSALSTVGNRFVNFATVGNTSHGPSSGASVYVYDLTTARWVLQYHDQGAWITRTFAAGNYTASAGNWTVASAGRDAYWLKGRTLFYAFTVSGTTSGTPVTVKIAIPASYVAAATDGNAYYVSLNGAGGAEGGYWQSAGALLAFQRYANVAFGAGTVQLIGEAQFEVQ